MIKDSSNDKWLATRMGMAKYLMGDSLALIAESLTSEATEFLVCQ